MQDSSSWMGCACSSILLTMSERHLSAIPASEFAGHELCTIDSWRVFEPGQKLQSRLVPQRASKSICSCSRLCPSGCCRVTLVIVLALKSSRCWTCTSESRIHPDLLRTGQRSCSFLVFNWLYSGQHSRDCSISSAIYSDSNPKSTSLC